MNAEPRRDPPPAAQNGPPSRVLVSPSRGPALPSPREKVTQMLPSPRERDQRLGQPSPRDQRDPRAGQPSPREQRDLRAGQPSPRDQRDRDRSPRLHPQQGIVENGLDVNYSRVSSAHLLTMATPAQPHLKQQSLPQRSQHSPGLPARPPVSSYSHSASLPAAHTASAPRLPHQYVSGYQMVSPPVPPHPTTSLHSLPGGPRVSLPPRSVAPPHSAVSSSHHGHLPGGHPHVLPPTVHQHLMRATSQPQLPPKK